MLGRSPGERKGYPLQYSGLDNSTDWIVHGVAKSWTQLSNFHKEIKPVSPKGNQPWIFIGRTAAKAPILWPLDTKSQLIGKDPDAGKDWGQEEKGAEDEMVGWHHQVNGHESEPPPGDGEGQGSLACCSPRGCKESDMTEWLNNHKGNYTETETTIPSNSKTQVTRT